MGNRKLAAKFGLRDEPGLNQIGLRDSDLLETRLQFPIVQQRHLHRAIGGQLTAENGLHALLDLRVLRAAAIPMDALSGAFADRRLHAIE